METEKSTEQGDFVTLCHRAFKDFGAKPLARFQARVPGLIAAHRDPESFVAGSTPLNIDRPRLSEDIYIFHDREERVARAAERDTAVLQVEELDIVWLRREPAIFSAEIRRTALDEAEAFVLRMPTEKIGLLFIKEGKIVQPDPDRLDDCSTHAGRRRGHGPSSMEMSAAMLERYGKE